MSLRSERRPMLTVEIQCRPPVPETASPYFWGNGTLTFRDENQRIVWEAEVPWTGQGATRVEKRDEFGWVIVTEYAYDKIDVALERLGLPRFIEGGPR